MKQSIMIILSVWIWMTACNDPVLVGSGLLDDETLDVGFVDSMMVKALTQEGDPSITYRQFGDGSYSGTTYMVGQMQDNIFGKSEAVTYFTPLLLFLYPEFNLTNLDSVVLSIPLDTLGFYGDTTAVHDLELKTLLEPIDLARDSSLFSDQILETGDVFASQSLTLHPTDSLVVQAYTSQNPDSLIKVRPQLRMPLEKGFWTNLITTGDTLTQDMLDEAVPGFALNSVTSASSMFGLDLAYGGINTRANINFYYNLNDTVKAIYRLPLGFIRHSVFTNDYSGSDLGITIEDEEASQLYLQSQAGTELAIDISDIRSYQDHIINSATIDMTIKEEDDIYPPIESVFAWAKDEDGDLQVVGVPSDPQNPITESFDNGERQIGYKINVTDHLNNVKKGIIDSDTIFIIAASKAQRPNRTIVYGTEDLTNPLKIELILTKP